MSTLYWILGLLLVSLAGAIGSAYYRRRALLAESAVETMKDIGAQWRVSNAQLTDRVARAESALLERHTREAAEDAVVQERAGGSADLAVELLKSAGRPGTSPGSGVSPGGVPKVPRAVTRKVP